MVEIYIKLAELETKREVSEMIVKGSAFLPPTILLKFSSSH